MALETLATATDLNRWASVIDARYKLPRLMRRLIHATTEQLNRVEFRADEGAQLGGWDGIVVAEDGNAFVPQGTSVWELGANSDIKGKADDDFQKRTDDPLGMDPANTTYIFVTPRRWGGKENWVREQQTKGIWREVRAYDAHDLEQWLQLAPAVHISLSILLRKHPEGAKDIASFWMDWAEETNPTLGTTLLTIGRQGLVDRIYAWLAETPSRLSLKADTKQEAVAFAAAAIHELPPDQSEPILSRMIIALDIGTWNHLCASESPLVLIPLFQVGDAVTRADRGGHHVLIPLGKDDSKSATTLELPRLHVLQTREALHVMGLSTERASELAPLARRSLMALRRQLARSPEVQQPQWATPEGGRAILPALLAGAWRDTREGDRNVMARLANSTYEDVTATLSRLANEEDPPVRHTGDTWLVVSKEDAWSLVSRYITQADMERFHEVVLEVLGEVNPSLELPAEQRIMAGILGRSLPHSGDIREGLADTLALMAARSEATEWSDIMTPQDRVNRVVQQLLEGANRDWQRWASLSLILLKLSEASPREYLRRVEAGLTGNEPVLVNLFQDTTSGFFASSPHTGLLWSLEVLAWHPDYLSRAAMCLAQLERLDPGGRLANRPGRSLRSIFLFWYPCTTATREKCFEVIDLLRRREPAVAWQLMRGLLPKPHDHAEPTSKPRYRDWVPEQQPPVTYPELWTAEREIVERMLTDVGTDGNRWKDMIEHIDDVQDEQRETIIGGLLAVDLDTLPPVDRLTIWTALRELISRHRRFPEAPWAMPREVVERLLQVYEHFEPDSPVDRYAQLFTLMPKLVHDFGDDWEAKRTAIDVAREEAVRLLYGEGGLALLLEFNSHIEQPYELGQSLARSGLLTAEDEAGLHKHLNLQYTPMNVLAMGYVIGQFLAQGWQWAEDKIASITGFLPSPEQQSAFFITLPFEAHTWDLLETVQSDIQQLYWSRVNMRRVAAGDVSRAVRNLLNQNRHHVALDLMSLYIKSPEVDVPVELIVEALNQAVRTPAEGNEDWQTLYYHVGDFLERIEASSEIEPTILASLELALLPFLEHSERGPKVLHEGLSASPALFLDALSLAYRVEGQAEQELTDMDRAYARLADILLRTWRRVPGTQEDGSIDSEALREWIHHVRDAASANGRGDIADDVIGQVMSFAPEDADGTWPSRPVRDIIEEIGTEQFYWGYVAGVLNRRGMVTRSLTEGGAQERELVEQYRRYANMVRDQWPRTADAVDEIAERYRHDAHREDISAELEEDMWH